MKLQSSLKDIDFQLEVMTEKNRLMVYSSVCLALISFFYYFFGISLQEEYTEKTYELISLEKKLSQNKLVLYEDKISKAKHRILSLAQKNEEARYAVRSLKVKLKEIDFLSSDAKGLADILDRLLKKSVSLDVSIEKIILDDTVEEYKAQIKKKGSIKIDGTANFNSVLKLIRFIESQEALLEIRNVHFALDAEHDTPSFTLMIIGYGIE